MNRNYHKEYAILTVSDGVFSMGNWPAKALAPNCDNSSQKTA